MRYLSLLVLLSLVLCASATILENGQPRLNPYPGQADIISLDKNAWKTYKPNAKEISYKGRWDSKHISSCIELRSIHEPRRSRGIQDWQFSNVTANATYQFVGSATTGLNLTSSSDAKTFELRDARISKVPEHSKMIEIIGDSLSSGDFATYEGLSSWAYDFAAGLGNVEYSITAYPGICLHDQNCWGNPRGQSYQWYRTSDTSGRAHEIYGEHPPKWNFAAQRPADLVVINIGTNDNNPANNVSSTDYYNDYVKLVGNIHEIWPKADVVLMSLWGGFGASGDTYVQGPLFVDEIKRVYEHYKKQGFIHYFDTTGILQHNDIAPLWHPTDVGHLKVAAHLMQWVKLKFGWEFAATGPEVHPGTLYWNDQQGY
ncbi:SGNH/GDSL hydrolase family protein [Aspergillus clavatus NRRL 1]|uniref:GDSL-like lipase/acylhydrolase, putative n=1 Tax=Aspergillus clavatus (strain ATCC 1007 / CBS 513.65 / DSM 816 / NCTC 3887 / NRRL 1 / QM 1276 / 107) TaxID=344612 RepID=A1CFQ0_ASPCL|nr:GDSL-like lipase/acylhydrolase, putative [Aspergillus clavatus NRRL 1]EAW11699.1 GDSL-like lipase/acylhydrolase, putative [Aspergillus clavatus NRRL 1]